MSIKSRLDKLEKKIPTVEYRIVYDYRLPDGGKLQIFNNVIKAHETGLFTMDEEGEANLAKAKEGRDILIKRTKLP